MTEGSSAVISPCGRYRYVLKRSIPHIRLDDMLQRALFIMLNPSVADASVNDPTIRRCKGFASSLGCTSLTVVNLFALRATNPAELEKEVDPVGPDNDRYIMEQVLEHRRGVIIAAWGAHPMAAKRQEQVINNVTAVAKLHALGLTKGGGPKHPLYLSAKRALFEYPVPHPVVLVSPHLTPDGE